MSEFKQDTYYEEGSDAGGMPAAHILLPVYGGTGPSVITPHRCHRKSTG